MRSRPGCSAPGTCAMKIVKHVFGSSLGKKYLMAVTGFFLLAFVVAHLVGNLQVFLGREAINRYGNFLQSNVELLWPARLFMLACVLLHIWSATEVSVENQRARPVGYGVNRPFGSTYASRHMLMSGLIVAAFIIYHLLHYTVEMRAINGTGQNFATFMDPERRHDVFRMMVTGFNNGWVSGFYLLGVGLLCLHLSHGASSMFQSMGWRNDAYRPLLDRAAQVFAVVIFLGYASIPVAILLGYGKEALQ
jgi:succinate dehydrogenase / fumarate reductase, cytochrome b subunit